MPKPLKPKPPELPAFGTRIPIEKVHISKTNIRANRPFGESEKDKIFIENVRRNGIVVPMLARPEGNGFGIYAGERKYHAAMIVGYKAFIYGKDMLINNVTDEQAREESLIENFDVYREEMNPLELARALQDAVDSNMAGLRAEARRLGIAPSTLSDRTSVLQLTPPMQEAVAKGKIFFKDARDLVRLKVGEVQEERLAEVLEKGGREAYMAEVQKIETGKGKRGRPVGKYVGVHVLYEVAHEMKEYEALGKLASAKNMTIEEYGKLVWKEHVKSLL